MDHTKQLSSVTSPGANTAPISAISGDQIKRDVVTLLTDYISANQRNAERVDPNYGRLWQSLQTLVDAGGKRLRPYLIVRSYGAWGGKDYHNILWIAAAYELLHVSLLVHDDIIDRDYQRHGKDNLAGVYRKTYADKTPTPDEALHYAHGAAIIGGDLCQSGLYQLVGLSDFSAEQKILCQQMLSHTFFIVGGGQLLDMESVMSSPDAVDARNIAQQKTANYSFISPMSIGARLGGASEAEVDHIKTFGAALGLAFQLRDDMLGTFGETALTGKSNSGDLREGKRTALMQKTLELAHDKDRKLLLEHLGNRDLSNEQTEAMRQAIRRSGSLQAIETEIHQLCEQATSELESMHIDNNAKQSFRELIIKVRDRKS